MPWPHHMQFFPDREGAHCGVCSSSMRSSPSSDLGSSLEPPASPFQQPQRSSIGADRLQALLGPISSDGPPVPPSGFSTALRTPRSGSSISRFDHGFFCCLPAYCLAVKGQKHAVSSNNVFLPPDCQDNVNSHCAEVLLHRNQE